MPLNPNTVIWRPSISDDLVLKLASLIEHHLMNFTDDDLESFLDKLQERSKVIEFKEWELEQELKRETEALKQKPVQEPKYVQQTQEEILAVLAKHSRDNRAN